MSLAAIIPALLSERPWTDVEPELDFAEHGDVGAPFVTAQWLEAHLAAGNVTVLDARPPPSTFTRTPGLSRTVPGAQRAQWEEFMKGDTLKPPAEVAAIYRSKGVSNSRPVVVYGGWSEENAWGEEGRVWWQLHWLNHTQAHILYGGIWAWHDSNAVRTSVPFSDLSIAADALQPLLCPAVVSAC